MEVSGVSPDGKLYVYTGEVGRDGVKYIREATKEEYLAHNKQWEDAYITKLLQSNFPFASDAEIADKLRQVNEKVG